MTALDLLSPATTTGGKGEFKETYADPPAGYAWTEYANLLIANSPYTSEPSLQADVYVQLYREAGEVLGASGGGGLKTLKDGDSTYTYADSSAGFSTTVSSRLLYWERRLEALLQPVYPFSVPLEVTL